MGRRAPWALGVLFVLAAAVAAAAFWGHSRYIRPGPSADPATIIVEPGQGTREIALSLAERGIVDDPRVFSWGVRLSALLGRDDRPLKAGEYLVPAQASVRDVVLLLREGRTVVRRLTLAEGLTTAQALDILNSTFGLQGEVEPVPDEGELLPETYHFSYGDKRQALIARMKRAMDEAMDELWARRSPDLPIATKREALILASIVEKETGVPEERKRVAAVFLNRLRKGMRLQSDPTVIYGLSNGTGQIDRPLSRKDLETPHAYNTYVIGGLPPGPIANPGRASIEAVLNPAETGDLYFVADGTGGHAFAKTLEEHNRNVARWRKLQREGEKSEAR